MSKKTIVVCDHIHQDGLDILANDSEINFINAADEPKDKLIAEIIPLADVAITRSSTDVDDAFLASAKNVTAVVRAGVGVDNVDIPGSSKQGIVIMNVLTAESICVIVSSTAAIVFAVGTFIITIPCLEEPGISTLSTPTQAIFSFRSIGVLPFWPST